MSAVADAHKSTMALASFAASLDPATLPAEVRQKLGWLLLDHLRVCSIGARLPWSDWSRRYVGLVGKAGASHVLFSPEHRQSAACDLPQRHLRLELRCRRHPCGRDAASRHRGVVGGARDRRARRRVGPEVLAAVVAGYETIIRIGLAVQPSHFKRGFQSTGTCDGFGTAAAAGRLLFQRG